MAHLLGPAFVAYLIADAIAAARGVDALGIFVAAVAFVLSLVFARRASGPEPPGARRLRWLSLAAAAALARAIAPDALRPMLALADATAGAVAAALLVDLALTVPDALLPRARLRLARVTFALGSAAAGVVGVLAWAPLFVPLLTLPRVPVACVDAPVAAAASGGALALVARLVRLARGGTPEAIAANAWPLLGLVLAAPLVAAWPLVALVDLAEASHVARLAPALAFALLVWAHFCLVDVSQRMRVGATSRRAIAHALALGIVLVAVVLVAARLGEPVSTRVSWALGVLVAGLVAMRVLDRLVGRWLAPARGRLLEACAEIVASTPGVRTVEDLAGILLRALRRAANDPSAEPVLHLLHPDVEVRIDAAGRAHVEPGAMRTELTKHLRAYPRDVLLRGPLEDQIVRQPALRPLIEAVVSLDALCVVPLSCDGELEGAFVVPRAARRSLPTLEEIVALENLARWVGGFVTVLAAERRARVRADAAEAERAERARQVDALRHEVDRRRAEEQLWREGRADTSATPALVAYGPAMRAVVARLQVLAPSDAPVLLTAEHGSDFEALARVLHDVPGSARGPFVACDCAAVRDRDAARALLGSHDPEQRGWLETAAGGTLFLRDLPALHADAQRALAAALDEGRVRRIDGGEPTPLAVRVVASASAPLTRLVELDGLVPELSDRFAPSAVRVPPLRERPEDMPSLVLLALDRAARRVGREAVGIEADAQAYLLAYGWPGDFAELEAVVTGAVTRTSGPRVRLDDLPALAGVARPGEEALLLDGSFEQVERRVLQRALARAAGNKTEAAQLLGLKRSTFTDKLRRHGLDDGKRPSRTPAPN